MLLVPGAGGSFGTVGLSSSQWAAALALGLVPLIVPEAWKLGSGALARTSRWHPVGVRT